ncbi:uncharacterized protein LOC126739287 [Anthonomus grandis grandis]|uniref:uncharacterized protein LOC126739287 n=1 Tax=Anthonomus grandis grandis TaxID=2921223 RepID=UPI002166ACC6|nr:uncharacterized protein LOC126739287 [Anthonomus grandis grandis]
MVTPFVPFVPDPAQHSSSDESIGYNNPSCYNPFQLVLARKKKYQLWPAAILGEATILKGYKVYFFRSKDIIDLPRENILMFIEYLLDKEVSFRRAKRCKRGILKEIHMDETTAVPDFLVEVNKKTLALFHVPFFDLFLTTKQANQVLPEKTSDFSLLSE